METNVDPGATEAPPNRRRSWIATAALATGLAVGAAGIAGAATGSSSSSSGTTSDTSATAPAAAPGAAADGTRPDPSTMTNGPGETLLTGDTATKVKDAALAAVPGATVIRVETDSGDAEYEAHLKKSDGSFVTVLLDSSFKVTSTESGFGPGPQGQRPGGPNAQAPSSEDSSSSN